MPGHSLHILCWKAAAPIWPQLVQKLFWGYRWHKLYLTSWPDLLSHEHMEGKERVLHICTRFCNVAPSAAVVRYSSTQKHEDTLLLTTKQPTLKWQFREQTGQTVFVIYDLLCDHRGIKKHGYSICLPAAGGGLIKLGPIDCETLTCLHRP